MPTHLLTQEHSKQLPLHSQIKTQDCVTNLIIRYLIPIDGLHFSLRYRRLLLWKLHIDSGGWGRGGGWGWRC